MVAQGSHSQIAVGQEVREILRSWSMEEATELGLFTWQWEIPSGFQSKRSPSAQRSSKNYITLWLVDYMQRMLHWKHQNRSFVASFLFFFSSFFFFTWTDLQENLCIFKLRPCVQTFGFVNDLYQSAWLFFLQSQPIATTHLQLLECKSCRLLRPSELCPQKCFGLDFSPPVRTVDARFFLYCF